MITENRMKPHIYKIIVALGIIGVYTAGFAFHAEHYGLAVIGLIAAFIMAVVSIDEDTKRTKNNQSASR